MRQSVDFCHKSDSDAREMPSLSSNSGDNKRVERKDGPMHILNENIAIKKHPAKSEKRGDSRTSSPVNPFKRRAEDDAREHAMRLDEKGYQTKCMHCGFVSNRGGIKRMRVHLAGGNPAKHLEGCPNAPPDVKTLMSEGISKKTKGTKIRTLLKWSCKRVRRLVKPNGLTSETTSSKKLSTRGGQIEIELENRTETGPFSSNQIEPKSQTSGLTYIDDQTKPENRPKTCPFV